MNSWQHKKENQEDQNSGLAPTRPGQRERDPNEIGVLWQKKTAKGGTWFSGVINGQKVVVFWNGPKSSEKAPDYRVLLALANGAGGREVK